jgi:hypothetical protein
MNILSLRAGSCAIDVLEFGQFEIGPFAIDLPPAFDEPVVSFVDDLLLILMEALEGYDCIVLFFSDVVWCTVIDCFDQLPLAFEQFPFMLHSCYVLSHRSVKRDNKQDHSNEIPWHRLLYFESQGCRGLAIAESEYILTCGKIAALDGELIILRLAQIVYEFALHII